MYLRSALDTSAATTILSALASRRGSQVVRSRSAKPLFAGSIPAPASFHVSQVESARSRAKFDRERQSEKAPVTQASACVSRLIQPLLWRCSRRFLAGNVGSNRFLSRSLRHKWRRRFRREKRSQNCERLRSEHNGNDHDHCCTFHVARSYQISTA